MDCQHLVGEGEELVSRHIGEFLLVPDAERLKPQVQKSANVSGGNTLLWLASTYLALACANVKTLCGFDGEVVARQGEHLLLKGQCDLLMVV